MNKIIIAAVAIVIIAGGTFIITRDNDKDSSSQNVSGNSSANDSSSNNLDPNNYTDGAEIGSTLDATDQSEVNVSISDNVFDTTYLKVKKGTKVTWTNQGESRHDITSASTSPKKGLGSDLLSNGQSYSFTFNETGTYEYFCTPHASQMKAVVTVVD